MEVEYRGECPASELGYEKLQRTLLGHALRGFGLARAGLCSLFRRIFRRALGLQLLGMEHPIATEAAVSQGLGIIFERVRRRLRTGVIHGQILTFLDQHKLHMRAHTLDRSRLD